MFILQGKGVIKKEIGEEKFCEHDFLTRSESS